MVGALDTGSFPSLELHLLVAWQIRQCYCIVMGCKLPLPSRISLPATEPSNQLLGQLKLEVEQ